MSPVAPAHPRRAEDDRLVRFDAVQRAAHWMLAVQFGILMATALPLYFGSLAGVVGRRELVAQIHLWSGLLLPVPLVVSLLGPWGDRMRRDVRRVNLWSPDEIRWLKRLGRQPMPRLDKFNPGQKLNAAFTGAAIVVLLATGSVLHWFGHFPVPWRTGATFVHDSFAFLVFVVVTGHVAFALTHRAALRSMLRGSVSAAWAARHAPRWLEEQRGAPNSPAD